MTQLEEAMMDHLKGQRAYHVANWTTFLANPTGVAEHGDFMETLEQTLEKIAHYDELIQTLETLTFDA